LGRAGPAAVGILANPAAGRDVRRLAARASVSTLESKRDQVARAAVGALAAGVRRIVVLREPLRVSLGALEALAVDLEVEALDVGARLSAEDTRRAARRMRDLGCGAVVVLGGDGTNRAVAQAWPEAPIVPISTGTNNAFPAPMEATSAGLAAGLVAAGALPLDAVARRAKIVRAILPGGEEALALVDLVRLVDDAVGNLMPFDPGRIRDVLLSRAEPTAMGVSPIGGLLVPCRHEDEFGVQVSCVGHDDGGEPLLVPISPGLFGRVHVAAARRLALGEPCRIEGGGVLAFDGDREHELEPGAVVEACVVREGPWVIDVSRALSVAAERRLLVGLPRPRDGLGRLPGCC